MIKIKSDKQKCYYCDLVFVRDFPIPEYEKTKTDLQICFPTTKEYNIKNKIYIEQTKRFVDHLIEKHQYKLFSNLNNELGINNGDLK